MSLLARLSDVKKGRIFSGSSYPREEAVKFTEEEFYILVEETFEALLPIYKTMINMK